MGECVGERWFGSVGGNGSARRRILCAPSLAAMPGDGEGREESQWMITSLLAAGGEVMREGGGEAHGEEARGGGGGGWERGAQAGL